MLLDNRVLVDGFIAQCGCIVAESATLLRIG